MDPTHLELLSRTLLIGVVSVVVQLPFALLFGRLLARSEFRGKAVVQSILVLPMFLPPVAVGLMLLLALAPDGPLGGTFSGVLFSRNAAIIAASVVSFPLMLRHVQEGFAAVPLRLSQVSRSLGQSPWRTFWRVELPLAKAGVGVGILLSFARGVSEYGATSVIAGVIPNHTETLATGLMRRLNSGDDSGALMLAYLSLAVGFAAVLISELAMKRRGTK